MVTSVFVTEELSDLDKVTKHDWMLAGSGGLTGQVDEKL